MLAYKVERKGKLLLKVDWWFPSSKTCSVCGHVHQELKLSDRTYVCPECGNVMDTAIKYDVDCIVMEYLDLAGKKRGSKKQRLHLWRAKYVQTMVTDKAHRNMIRAARVCAWNTSRLAFDGSGRVMRGKEADLPSYSLCRFPTGKQYNCDLNASYNIGSRYYIRELLKTLPVTVGQVVTAKVPELAHRSKCTLSSLIKLNAVLVA